MNEPTHELEAYFAGDCTDEQLRAVEAWINSNPANARSFMDQAHFRELLGERMREQRVDACAVLAELARYEEAAEIEPGNSTHPPVQVSEAAENQQRVSLRQAVGIAGYLTKEKIGSKVLAYGSLAAALLVAAVLLITIDRDPSEADPQEVAAERDIVVVPVKPAARLIGLQAARWHTTSGRSAPRVGDALGKDTTLQLVKGFARLRFAKGAEVIVQAPARLSLDSDRQLSLEQGRLVAHCRSASSKGFIVRTPTARVVDVSTSFGVAYEGQTRISVLEGEVTVAAVAGQPGAEPIRLGESRSAVVARGAPAPTVTELSDERFVSQWTAVSQSPKVRGDIRFEMSMPRSVFFQAYESPQIVMFLEQAGLTLVDDVALTVSQPGTHHKFDAPTSSAPAGMTVDSYLLHLDVLGNSKENTKRVATVRFDRPILGVIATGEHLALSDAQLAHPGVYYGPGPKRENPGTVRGIESGTGKGDAIQISEDRRTLTISMMVLGESIDQVRVLVGAKQPE